jgi:hypothetical protein
MLIYVMLLGIRNDQRLTSLINISVVFLSPRASVEIIFIFHVELYVSRVVLGNTNIKITP